MSRNIRLVEFQDEEIYPIMQSLHGSNAYYCDFCNYAGYRPSYASCLRRIMDVKEERLATEASCSTAISKGVCPALAMMEEEKHIGRAIYYVNREKVRQNQEDNAELIDIKLGTPVSRKLINPTTIAVYPQYIDINNCVPNGIGHASKFKSEPTLANAINKKILELAKEEAVANSFVSYSKSQSIESKNIVIGDLFKSEPIKTQGLSLLEIARLHKQSTIN